MESRCLTRPDVSSLTQANLSPQLTSSCSKGNYSWSRKILNIRACDCKTVVFSCTPYPIARNCLFKIMILRIITPCLIITLVSIKVAENKLYTSAWDAMEPVNRLRRPVPELGNSSVVDVLFPNSNIFSLITVNSRVLHLISENNVGMEEKNDFCNSSMQNFAQQAAAFTKCLLSYARPFRLCEKCVTDYTLTRHQYQIIQVR